MRVVEIIHVYRAPNFITLESYKLVKILIAPLDADVLVLSTLTLPHRRRCFGSVDLDVAP